MNKLHLIDFFDDTVAKFPDKTALIDHNVELTFKELSDRAKAIAWQIEELGENRNRPVAIFLKKSWQAVVSIFGALYSGNSYSPLDIDNPTLRLIKILRQLDPCCIITDVPGSAFLKRAGSPFPQIILEEIDFKCSSQEPSGYKNCIDTDPAYIIHTSGSTGFPKGVVISHLGIRDYIWWAIETFDITEEEHIGNQAPLFFDNSTLDLHLMTFTGATLCLIPKHLFIFPVKLMDYVNAAGINFVFWVPSVLINVANLKVLDNLKVHKLKKVLFAGEVMPAKQLNYWRNHMGSDVLFANLYGPTEITVDCTYHILDRIYADNEIIPIGKACKNSDVLILNDDNRLCRPFEQGELWVRGSSLAQGYWNNRDKTDSVFVQNPLHNYYPEKIYRTGDLAYVNEQGEILFVGRMDHQIKHHGYRIELGEIEYEISNAFEDILPCALYDDQQKKIVLIYQAPKEISPIEFRKSLSKRLARYMIPSKFIRVGQLLYNENGKVDRIRLKSLIFK